MGDLTMLAGVSTQGHLDTHTVLIPLVTGLSLLLVLLLAVVGYGVRRVKISEGLVMPTRTERPYAGPELTWASLTEPARKLVAHDTLGLGSDLSWLNTRNIPAPLFAHPAKPQPIVALEFAAQVYTTKLPVAGTATPILLVQPRDNARREKMAAQAAQSEKLAALRHSVGVTQPRAVAAAAAGQRPRTAVLRAADPRPPSTGNKPLSTSDTFLAQPVKVTSRAAATPTARAVPAACSVEPAGVTAVNATPRTVQVAPAAAPAPKNSAKTSNAAPEGRVTDYSFADFL